MMDTLMAWLADFPGWETPLTVDTSGPGTGLGLFPRGVETVQWERDILGNTREVCRAVFALCRVGLGQEGDARWLLDFQQWVRQQQRLGLAPRFGIDPARSRITARAGQLKDARDGLRRYTVELVTEFVC